MATIMNEERAVRGGSHFSNLHSLDQPNIHLQDLSVHSAHSIRSENSVRSGDQFTPMPKKLRTFSHTTKRIHVGVAQVPNKKDQDRFAVELTDDPAIPHYFAVFDGHGTSSLAADLCTENLLSTIMEANSRIQRTRNHPTKSMDGYSSGESWSTSSIQPQTDPDVDESKRSCSDVDARDDVSLQVPCDEAIRSGFSILEQQVLEYVNSTPRTGTCAVCLMVGIEGNMDEDHNEDEQDVVVKCAWVGDSRCIMIDNDNQVTALTEDHRVHTNPKELQRVTSTKNPPRPGLLNSEGWRNELDVAKTTGVRPRASSFVARRVVNGMDVGEKCIFAHTGGISLQISRSIGDCYGARSVICEPEITTIRAKSNESARFIIGSDGLWDVISNEDAALIVKSISNPTKAATKLLATAKNKRIYSGRSSDDITVVVIDVNREHKPVKRKTSLRKSISLHSSLNRFSGTQKAPSNNSNKMNRTGGQGGKCAIM